MDGEANLPAQSGDLHPPPHPDSGSAPPFAPSDSSSSLPSSSCPPDFLRNVQAAFKRHRPLVPMQSSNIVGPMRILVPQREAPGGLASRIVEHRSQNSVALAQAYEFKDSVASAKSTSSSSGQNQEDSVPSIVTDANERSHNPFDIPKNLSKPVQRSDGIPSSNVDFHYAGGSFQLSEKNVAHAQGADGRMATEMDDLSSHLGSLVLAEMEWEVSNPPDASTSVNQDTKQTNLNADAEANVGSFRGIPSLLSKRTTRVHDQLNQFGNFFQSDVNHQMTQSSMVGSVCATSTLIHSTSAPMVSSTASCFQSHPERSSHVEIESHGNFNENHQPIDQGDALQPSQGKLKDTSGVLIVPSDSAVQPCSSVIDGPQKNCPDKGRLDRNLKGNVTPKEPSPNNDNLNQDKGFNLTDILSQAPMSRNSSTDVKLEPSKSARQEKTNTVKGTSAPRKRNYDPDFFFKVNGKLYQRLGKIGTGGSSEVHKVISSDCTIYALKKIKLKGRDYATAYGFCQEIEYLNKLKGKNHIIQLIDYEVSDKTMLQEVFSGSLENKDRKVKDDGYIYMILEYGEIDLAHMLSLKWKELDDLGQSIDENWLRFYWQQILLAVNTIHEERIVHSDLKPANFLLVKGSLKLIDFGIAKAIMNDTTHIQRDSQVGTLSYMSPEAFMCNENDVSGNIIKCGRPSDIWSLGCILYQMVYGRTPFSEYKTFWAKFKVITNRNHEIVYDPLPNSWLLDLMKKCLSWDMAERWRIPELLKHPFLVPPVSPPQDPGCSKLLETIAQACADDEVALGLYGHLKKMLTDPPVRRVAGVSRDQCCELVSGISKCCLQLQQYLGPS